MNLKTTFGALVAALFISTAPTAGAAAPASGQPTFPTPAAAASALADAARSDDPRALDAVLGAKGAAALASGDPVADRRDRARFAAAYDLKHEISQPAADGRAFLVIGDDGWQFPAPLVQRGSGWAFDMAAGRDELTSRRIGRNELDTIQTLRAIVDAQREYAAGDPDGNGFNDYARRFVSSEGKKDGLFWPTADNEPPSPLGPLLGKAAQEGYAKSAQGNQPTPYHGYRYRILTAQGVKAPGGAYSYLVGEKLLGGFAVVAYPAKYGASGVMTFVVNHDGTVYEKNLGKNTESVASGMRRYNPDAGWKKSD